MSRWKDIYLHLKSNNIDVYAPGYHQGECTSPYVVVRDEGESRYGQYSSTQNLYSLLCYVPARAYSTLEPFVDQIETLMEGLYPMMRSAHYRTPSFYDDTVKGYMISTQYINYRKYIK